MMTFLVVLLALLTLWSTVATFSTVTRDGYGDPQIARRTHGPDDDWP
ncbi:hypothetical protein [Cryobacterium algoricola]|nr:hypothetical protein [Cryobacterium algoricola]